MDLSDMVVPDIDIVVDVSSHGVERSVRSKPPTNFMFKIESYKSLSAMLCSGPEKKYESGIFEAGGYKWKLSVYPNGNKKENGKYHVSLYLVLADENSLPHGFEINVKFKLFVYDHFEDKYLTVEDAIGRARRFSMMKKEWGFAQFLRKNIFCNTSNGFLVDDSCVFGADVSVIENKICKVECLSMIKEHGFSWNINNFSKIDKLCISRVFNAVGSKWRLSISLPGGRDNKRLLKKEYMGLCLQRVDEDDDTTFSKLMKWFWTETDSRSRAVCKRPIILPKQGDYKYFHFQG